MFFSLGICVTLFGFYQRIFANKRITRKDTDFNSFKYSNPYFPQAYPQPTQYPMHPNWTTMPTQMISFPIQGNQRAVDAQ
jgi:hypothetical protein